MKLGIIGTPQCGKTTVFNAAAQKEEAVGDYSQASHRAVVKVPDDRVDQLAEIANPAKITYAEIDFLDAPGFTGKGKAGGAIEFTPELREMDALIMVIDAFSDDANPRATIGNLFDEMKLSDQVIVENNIENKKKRRVITGDKKIDVEIALLERLLVGLEDDKPLIEVEMDDNERKALRGYQFMSLKPVLVVLNINENDLPRQDEILNEYSDLVNEGKREVETMCGKVQMELVGLDSEEQQAFFDDLGIKKSARDKVVQKAYKLLGLISFLTTGPKEVRAWPIRRGTTAVKAAGAVHSDIERGFIRAEVTHFADHVEYKTAQALKAAGKTRLEGKEYVVQDGDEILFRFNV